MPVLLDAAQAGHRWALLSHHITFSIGPLVPSRKPQDSQLFHVMSFQFWASLSHQYNPSIYPGLLDVKKF
jgi:hypothetical protein